MPSILTPNILQDTECKHRKQDTNTAHNRRRIKFDPRLLCKVNGDTLEPKVSHKFVSIDLVSAHPHKTFFATNRREIKYLTIEIKTESGGTGGNTNGNEIRQMT